MTLSRHDCTCVVADRLSSPHASVARRGSALVMALIVVMLVSSLGAGFLHLSASVTRRQTDEVEKMRAFYLAEAGLAEAFQAVRMGRSGQVGTERVDHRRNRRQTEVHSQRRDGRQQAERNNESARLEKVGVQGRVVCPPWSCSASIRSVNCGVPIQ